jgi:acyl-CoA synthetase (AMP-forming)/AMP-acid ligase II
MYPGAIAQKSPDKAAIIMADSGETMTFQELHDYAEKVANLLQSAGLEPGDHIALCLENRLEFLPICWGAHYAGLYYTAISSRLTAPEISYIIKDCGAGAFLTSPYKGEEAAELIDDIPDVFLRLSVGGAIEGFDSLDELLIEQETTPQGPRVEGADMLYSSGTTGRPKGVKSPLPGVPLGETDGVTTLLGMLFGANPDSVYLSPAPLYHAAPLRFCRGIQKLGGTVVVMPRFGPVELLESIEKYKTTLLQAVPTMFVRLLKLEKTQRESFDVSSLQSVVHAAAPCPIPVKKQMIDWWGEIIHEYYAGTEGNGFCYCNSKDWLAHEGTVGRAIQGILHIVNDDGNELPTGEIGGVYFESDSVFEYHNAPEKTKGARLENGWSTLGDIGKVDEDGFLYLTDRKAFMIISGGVNIYPQEAENVLTMHDKVLDVAVFGVPNDDLGEEVKAVVQLIDPTSASPQIEQELLMYCQEQLARVKCPRTIDFREELPRHPTGKLYKRLLRDEYWGDTESRIV